MNKFFKFLKRIFYFFLEVIVIVFLIVLLFKLLSNFHYVDDQKFYNVLSPISTIFVCLIGVIFTWKFEYRYKHIEYIRAKIKDKRDLFVSASKCVNSRYYDLCRVIWALEDIKSREYISKDTVLKIKMESDIYMKTLRDYNIEVKTIAEQMRYVCNEQIYKDFYNADEFNDNNDHNGNFKSLAGKFREIHILVKNLKEMIIDSYDYDYPNIIRKMEAKKDKFGYATDKNIKALKEIHIAINNENYSVHIEELKKKHSHLHDSINKFLNQMSKNIYCIDSYK